MILLMNVDKDNPSVAEGENVQIQGAGLTGFELKGNTHQDSYTGKNLFNYNIIDVSTITIDNDGTILISGTEPSSGYTLTNKTLSQLCPSLQVGDTVYFYIESDFTERQYMYSSDGSFWRNGNSKTITQAMLNANIILYGGYQTTSHLKIMITNQLETSFEKFVGGIPSPNPDYPQPIEVVTGDNTINVHGKNLAKSKTVYSTTNNYAKVLYVDFDIKPNTTYTFSFNGTSGNTVYFNENIFTTANYVTISNNRVESTVTTKSTILSSQYEDGKGWAILKNAANNTNANVFDDLQIEKGSATPYQPYQSKDYEISLGDIELCKIGDYQDYIYKENNKWYKHSEIGKVVLDGSEIDWNYGESGETGIATSSHLIDDMLTGNYLDGLTNYFHNDKSGKIINSIRFGANNSRIYLYYSEDMFTSRNDLIAWLSTHNTIVYYVLATPTNTEITDTDLIEQLEAISNIALFEGVNNISMESSNLTSSFKVYYDTWYEFDKILRNGYNIREDRDRITQKFANGHRKQFVSDYVDCSITLNLDTIDKDTTQDYLQRLKSGAYKYYSIDGKEYRTAQFIIENKPELSVENSISNNVDVNEYQITLLKAGD